MVTDSASGSGITSSNLFIRKPFFGGLVLHQFPKNQENTPFSKSLYKPSEELPSCPYGLGVKASDYDAAGVSSNPVTSFIKAGFS